MPLSLPAGCCHPQERTPSLSPIGPPRSLLSGPSAVTPSLPLWVPLENQCALRSAHLPFPIPVLAQCITSKRAGLPQKGPQLDICSLLTVLGPWRALSFPKPAPTPASW